MRSFAWLAILGMSVFGLVACCCSTVAEEETGEVPLVAGVDGGEETPTMSEAGWVSPVASKPEPSIAPPVMPASGGGSADWSQYRSTNARLRQQVEGLSREVDTLIAERSAAPVDPAPMPAGPLVSDASTTVAPAPAGMTVEGVRAALSRAGASEIKVAQNAQNEVFLTIPGTTFSSGKATLKPEAMGLLQRAVGALQSEFPALRLRVEGHTDSQPIRRSKWGTNLKLSEARAGTVKNHIVSSTGVAAADVVSIGYGAARPVASNKTAADMAKNRRCELVLLR